MSRNLIIFTDLDGTLLDSDYSFAKAKPALDLLRKNKIPLILCSSKTRAEIEYYRKKLKNNHPFVSENGGGIFIPKNYFKLKVKSLKFKVSEENDYKIICLGAGYSDLRNALKELCLEGFDVRGFGDMGIKEVAGITGLKTREARMAKQRDFDEPFIFNGSKKETKRLLLNIKKKGFNYTQGEFSHIMGKSDKGSAVEILKKLYTKQNRRIITAALGDSPNDIEMLERVDYPIIVQKDDGRYDRRITLEKVIKAEGAGPEGWNKAVMKLLKVHGL